MFKKSILITGASKGIGLYLVQYFVDQDYMVYGCSRGQSPFIRENYEHFCLDVSEEVEVIKMFTKIYSNKLPLEILINNAGVSQASLGLMTSNNDANKIIQSNLIGAFLVTREALKLMMRHKYGRIINFSSINVQQRSSGSSIYNASKAGLVALSETLARECSGLNITLNTIVLSIVENSGMALNLNEKLISIKKSALLKPEFLSLNEVIHAINFFTSPLAKNITCQKLNFGGI